MTRFKYRPRISLKMKIWLAIMTMVIAVIAFIWIFQVVFLEDYYVRLKRNDFEKVTEMVLTAFEKGGLRDSQDDLLQIARDNTLCIDISASDGTELITYEGLSYNCYIHRSEENRLPFLREAQNGERRISTTQVKNLSFAKEYFISDAMVTLSQNGVNSRYILIVTQTLPPVQEAAMVVRNQLMIISILTILIATAMAFLIARTMTKPLRKITNAARQIAGGSLNVNVDVKSNDELGDLGANFNYMSREISKVNILQKELVANISHDIRTPLTMIRGYAETIKDITGEDPELRNQQLDIIIDETNRLSTLVSDVMDLSLLQAGQSPLHPTVFCITAKCRDILGRFQLLEQTRGFEFRLEASRELWVSADEVRIEQVLYNLINNAVNHIGEIKRITVRVLEEKECAKVEVEDTGTGIAQEDLPLIWDRYYKPYKKGQKASMGTGLGLSIVKAVLVNHHSNFGVNSTLGAGSTFWFNLRLAELPPALPETAQDLQKPVR